MKKRVYGKTIGRRTNAKKALLRSLAKALIEHGSIKTTKAKAKVVQGFAEKLASLTKDGSLDKRRKAYAMLGNDRKATDKLFDQAPKRFKKRDSGFTRIINLPERKGDLAKMARIEWTGKISSGSSKSSKSSRGKKKDKK